MAPSAIVEDAPTVPITSKGSSLSTVTNKLGLEDVIRDHELVPLWNTGAPPSPPVPHSKHVPAVWKYADTRKLLIRASELVDAKEAERRALLFINPGPKQPPFTLDTLLGAHQLITPGEKALCHRHTPFAVRFLIEGENGYTAIKGKKMYMRPGDLIITPQWQWHDHGNEGTQDVTWLDGLNIPLFKHLPIDFTDHYESKHGGLYHPSKVVDDEECQEMKFPWVKMQAALDAETANHVQKEYLLPDGKSVSTTIGAWGHKVSKGMRFDVPVKDTASRIFQVHAGSGTVEVIAPDGNRTNLKWTKHDAFCVPAWHDFDVVADVEEDAYLFMYTDMPMLRNLGLYKVQGQDGYA